MAAVPLSELSLYPATPEQVHESRTRHSAHWRKNNSVEDYLRRDQVLEKLEHAKDNKLVTWFVRDHCPIDST